MNETGIIWTEATWNPASGCELVSEGCKYCYALTLAERKRGTPAFPHGFDLTLRPHKLTEPFRLKQPMLVFVNSMSDLFWDEIPDSYRDKVMDVIEETPQHEYQILTKRPENMLRYSLRRKLPLNVWAGVTVESERLTGRIGVLRMVDAAIRFVSAEPLLSPLPSLTLDGIHWLISGGESGAHLSDPAVASRRALVEKVGGCWQPREDRYGWVRELRDQCTAQRVAFFHKQWGGPTPASGGRMVDGRTHDEFPRLPHLTPQPTLFS